MVIKGSKLFFISNAFKVIEAFKTPDETIYNRETLIERLEISWAYSGKLINQLTGLDYLKKTKVGRRKAITLTTKGKKLYNILKKMRKHI